MKPLVLAFALAACHPTAPAASHHPAAAGDLALPTASRDAALPDEPGDGGALVAERPYNFVVPTGYDAATPTPLVILLHGYGASGNLQNAYFRGSALANRPTFLFAYPDGTPGPNGDRFWNA